jgi:hypothetical protein
MYRPFRQTAISGHTRVISGHKMAETYHAILPLLLYTVKQETNEMKQSESHSSLLKTLRRWAGKEYYRSLRMAIHKETNKEIRVPKSETSLNPTINEPSVIVELPLVTRYRWELPLPAYFVAVGDRQSYTAYLSCQHLRRWLYSLCI